MVAVIFLTLAYEGQEQVKVSGSEVTCLILALNNGLGITLFDGP